jgi:outer membrane protein assembly factor BamA
VDRIERWYRARGYYEARVLSSLVLPPEALRARRAVEAETGEPLCPDGCEASVEITIEEGEPTRVTTMEIQGAQELPEQVRERLSASLPFEVGDRFDEVVYDEGKRKLERMLADSSYAHGRVEGAVRINPRERSAEVVFQVDAGPPCRFGPITVVGNEGLSEDVISGVALIEEGTKYSHSALVDAQRQIYALGAFSTVEVEPQIPEDRQQQVVPIRIRAVPGRLFRTRLGVGIQSGTFEALEGQDEDVEEWDLHALSGLEFKNFLGGLRRLTVEERIRAIFPAAFPGGLSNARPGNALSLHFSQPGLIEPRTTLKVSAAWEVGPDPYQRFFRHDLTGALGPERSFFDGRLFVGARLKTNLLFPIDSGPSVPSSQHVTFLEEYIQVDLRDDAIRPSKGVFLQLGLHEAGYFLPSSWNYFRWTPEIRGYVPLPLNMVLASRLSVAALHITEADSNLDDVSERLGPQRYRLRGGGATSNRGYLPGDLGDSPDGGLRRWELAFELRIPLTLGVGTVLFADMADVHGGRSGNDPLGAEKPRWRLDHPHLSVGMGLRWQTVLGPVRADLAWQVPEAQVIGQPDSVEGRPQGNCRSRAFGSFCGAFHLTIQEAF